MHITPILLSVTVVFLAVVWVVSEVYVGNNSHSARNRRIAAWISVLSLISIATCFIVLGLTTAGPLDVVRGVVFIACMIVVMMPALAFSYGFIVLRKPEKLNRIV